MDLPVLVEQDKKIADLRKQLTPGEDGSCDEVGSEEQDCSYYQKTIVKQFNIDDKQQQWADTSVLEEGQSLSLLPKNLLSDEPKDKKQEEQEVSIKTQQQKEPVKKQRKGRNRNYDSRQEKVLSVKYDSKFIFAAYELLFDELKKQISAQMGSLRFNPYINTNEILIYYYDEKDKQKIADIVDDHINELQVMDMSKNQAQSGVQLSQKYRQQLLKQKISFFKDKSQNFKSASYYICGYKVKKNILYQKISEIKKIHFIWVHLFRFQNTRSYRAILRKILETPQMHTFILQKFKAKQIEIAALKKDFPLPNNADKTGVLIILTIQGEKKVSIHQQVQHQICGFIRQNFLVFCFSFIRRKQGYKHKYTPKVQRVTWFFIEEKNVKIPLQYLYIIVNKKDFEQVKGTIIKEIQIMKLEINGHRFFKGLYPDLKDKEPKKEIQRIYSFPRVRPYSWTLRSLKGVKFDWVSQLNI